MFHYHIIKLLLVSFYNKNLSLSYLFKQGVSLALKIQCVFLAVSALLEVFMYAWPAEHLIHIVS